MKFFNPIIFTAIALSVFAFPTGCVQKKPQMQPVRRAVAKSAAKPSVDKQKELDLKLLKAAHAKDLATVKDCVKKGGNVNVKDPSGWSAAMWSVWHWFDDKPLCAYIMHSGGEFAQHQKNNLLERAARAGDCSRAEFFLNLGANPNYENAFGENCATLALRYFRGQYEIEENENALPRYGNLSDINEALRLNADELLRANTLFEKTKFESDAYQSRERVFSQKPQDTGDRSNFNSDEFEKACAFYKTTKDERNVPDGLDSASAIYNALLSEADAGKKAAEKNLQYVKFIALLKAKGANLRQLLAGTQDDSGKQDEWKGQEDKWTIDPIARLDIHKAFPVVVDGLWYGELALIQLIGRSDEIFKKQIQTLDLPVPQEYLFTLYLKDREVAEAAKQGIEAVSDLIVAKEKNTRKVNWSSARMGIGISGDDGFLSLGAGGGSIVVRENLTEAETESARAEGERQGSQIGRYLGAIELALNGEKLVAEINSRIEGWNAPKRELNARIFELYEEAPLEGELAEQWKETWAARIKAQAATKKALIEKIRPVLVEYKAKLDEWVKNPEFNPEINDFDKAIEELEARIGRQKEEQALLERFFASDFFKDVPVEELIANLPHPRDVDPNWYKKHCIGEFKKPEIFVEAAKALLDYGVDVNARANETNHPALVCAYLWDKPEFEKLLLNYGADKKLALFHVCELNDFDLLKKMFPRINSLTDVPEDSLGNSILHRAVLAGRADMIPEIVKRGVPVNVQNKHDDTPLHLAAEKEDEACVIALLNAGASVYAKDKDGRKPIQRFWNIPSPKLTKILADPMLKSRGE